MKTLITAGGELSSAFLSSFINENPQDFIIAADRGMDVLAEAGIVPDIVLGDFDSTGIGASYFAGKGVKYAKYPAEKDFSDLEAALLAAVECKSTEISVLGATGGRLDHFLAAVMNLSIPLSAGIPAYIIDEKNRISLRRCSFVLKKDDLYGKYVSLLPYTYELMAVTLRGFKYDGENILLGTKKASYGLSNEVTAQEAEVKFDRGMLIVVESDDAGKA